MSKEIVDYLKHLVKIYKAMDAKHFENDIANIERIISDIGVPVKTTEKKAKKKSFREIYQFLLEKEYHLLTGTKLNYQVFGVSNDIIKFIETNSKADVIKETTALDLKLLYSLLTNDPTEIKGTKSDLYEAIKRNVRAKRRGEAFVKSY